MNLLATAPLWTVSLLLIVLALAALQDAAQLKISNWFPILILVLHVAALLLAGVRIDYWQNLLVFGLLLGLGTLLFAAGKMGGGDIKLFAVTGLWVDLTGALTLIAAIFIAGGVLAVVLIAARTIAKTSPGRGLRILQKNAGIPYGMAIAIGTMIAVAFSRTSGAIGLA